MAGNMFEGEILGKGADAQKDGPMMGESAPGQEISCGAPGFYRDMLGRSHFVSREIGEKKVLAKLWIEISKEEATGNSMNAHRESMGIADVQ